MNSMDFGVQLTKEKKKSSTRLMLW